MTNDPHLGLARAQVENIRAGKAAVPVVRSFFDEATFTASHVVHDPLTRVAAIIDPVLDFDLDQARISTASAAAIVAHVRSSGLAVEWLLETHIHADHLSASAWLREQVGGTIAIGSQIVAVQHGFEPLLDEGEAFARDGSQFGRLFADGAGFALGSIPAMVLHVPGHTPADAAYVIGDCAFVGDTMFMPDFGSARVDFPGGDARLLYRSIRRLMGLPGSTRVFHCHDYKAPGRDHFAYETTIAAQRSGNVHVNQAVAEDDFAAMRIARDSQLPVPRLLGPSLEVNMRAGRVPRSLDRT